MTRRRRDRKADILSRRLDSEANILPTVRDHLAEQRHNARLATSNNEGGRSKGTHSDPTGQLACSVETINDAERELDDLLASIELGVNLLDKAARKALGKIVRPTENEPKCHQVGCDELVSSYVRDGGSVGYRLGGEHGGLCDTHRARARREALKAA